MSGISHNPTRTLVAFCGKNIDYSLATDFVAISKKLISDGLNPTCMAGTHLRDIMEVVNFPLVFGREDMGSRTEIYTRQESLTPFYQMASPQGLKRDIIDWVGNAASALRSGDRLTIVLIGHGQKQGGDLKITTRGRDEYMSKSEMVIALSRLPANVRVSIINEACYSGCWGSIASEVGQDRDVLIEASAQDKQKAWSWYSGSGKNRCSVFAMAWLREITTSPEGRIYQHISRIEEEMDFVPPHQDTSTPKITTSARSLRSYNLSHFILPANIAQAVMNAASPQDAHEDTLRSRTRARRSWGSLWRFARGGRGGALDANDDAVSEYDMDLAVIQEYLDDLGSLAQEMDRSALANMCQYVLEGGGEEHGMKQRVVKTILWQELQEVRVRELVLRLKAEGHVPYNVDADVAAEALENHSEDVGLIVHAFNQIPVISDGLQSPSWEEGYVPVFYQDAFQHLVDVVACNKLLLPRSFDFSHIEKVIIDFLKEN